MERPAGRVSPGPASRDRRCAVIAAVFFFVSVAEFAVILWLALKWMEEKDYSRVLEQVTYHDDRESL